MNKLMKPIPDFENGHGSKPVNVPVDVIHKADQSDQVKISRGNGVSINRTIDEE